MELKKKMVNKRNELMTKNQILRRERKELLMKRSVLSAETTSREDYSTAGEPGTTIYSARDDVLFPGTFLESDSRFHNDITDSEARAIDSDM